MKSSVGSSPLARGLHQTYQVNMTYRRIIPARAGFTFVCEGSRSWLQDHPRSRGVYVGGDGSPAVGGGSSPLARGLPPGRADRQVLGRIIPARAGFTRCCCWAWTRAWDHPRSRGVYSKNGRLPVTSVGSSPLARGLPRITRHRLDTHGSSPLARGLRIIFHPRNVDPGIIPARAGFT